MEVSVVITCWNGKKLLEKNLPSVIKAKNNPGNHIVEIIVVDDGSTDDSVAFLKNNYSKEIHLVEQEKNFGYAITCNAGVKVARGLLVAILNLDVVPDRDFLEDALPHFANEKVFSVSFNEGKYGRGKIEWRNGFLEIVPTVLGKNVSPTDWPSGGSSVFRKSIWEKLGGMSVLFSPFYFEDVDLGLRAKKSGYLCLWEPKCLVEHEHEATINSSTFSLNYINSIKQRNHLILTWRNVNSLKMLLIHITNLLVKMIRQPGYVRIFLLSLKRFIFV